MFTYNVKQALPADTKLVLTITDDTGRQIRRLDLDKTAGLRRIAWNLRTDPPRSRATALPGAAPVAAGAGRAVRRRPRRSAQGPLVAPGTLPRDARPHGRRERDADRHAADVLGRADTAVARRQLPKRQHRNSQAIV